MTGRVQPQIKKIGGGVVLLFLAVVLFACKSSQTSTSNNIIWRSEETAALYALGPNTVIEINEDEEEIYTVQEVEEKPLYNGTFSEELRRDVALLTMYPIYAIDHGITGMVIVEFIVVENGSLANVKIIQSAHPILDAEALRVIKSLPAKWTPAKKDGKPVKMKYTYPFLFRNEK